MKRVSIVLVVILALFVLAACAQPTPPPAQIIRETVVVEKQVEVTTVVEKQVEVTTVVEKQVEVTSTPVPTAAPEMINGFPTTDENEAKTAQAAWDAADKGQPDPAWKDQKFTIGVYSAGQRGAISGPTYFWRNKFEELTGATYDIVEIPFAEMREKIFTDFQTGTNQYDVIINCSNWYGDSIANDLIQPIDKYFDDPRMPKWDRESIPPSIANLMQWGGQWYGTNNDHDAQVLYYRKDIIDDPKWQAEYKEETGEDMPVAMDTWEDVLKIAQFFNGKDWNGDGDPDDGITLHLKVGGQGFFHFLALSAPYVVTPAAGDDPTKVTKYNNVYFFDPETMEPLINSPGPRQGAGDADRAVEGRAVGHVGLETRRGLGGLPVGQRHHDLLLGRCRLAGAGPDPVGDPGQAGRPRHPRHEEPLQPGDQAVREPGQAEHGRQPGGLLVAPGAVQVRQEPRSGLLLDGLAGAAADQPLECLHGLDRRRSRHHL